MRKIWSPLFQLQALTIALALSCTSAWAQSPVPFINQEGVSPGTLDFDDSNLNTFEGKGKSSSKEPQSSAKNAEASKTIKSKVDIDQALEDGIFEKVYKNPDSLMLNLELAQIQFRNGNLKGAAATLGRILDFYPNESIAQLLLAQTEFQLGNFVEAKEYFRAVLNNPSTKPDQTAIAQKGLEALLDSEKLWRFGVQFQAGIGKSINPLNSSKYITIFGTDIPTNNNISQSHSTWLYLAAATLERAIESQSNHSIVFSASRFNQQYPTYDIANLGVNTATLAYQAGDISDRVVIGVNSSSTSLSNKGFINSNWGNASYQTLFGSNFLTNLAINYGYNNQLEGANYAGSSDRSNWMSGMVLGAKYFINADWLAEINLSRYRYAAKVSYESYNMGYGVANLSYATKYGVLGIFASTLRNRYADVDPLSSLQRNIQTNSFGGSYAISLNSLGRPQKKDWILTFSYQEGHANSNVQTYVANSSQYMALISKAF